MSDFKVKVNHTEAVNKDFIHINPAKYQEESDGFDQYCIRERRLRSMDVDDYSSPPLSRT